MAILLTLERPIDRYQALRLGACSMLAATAAEQCINGLAEEKRELKIWVRNRRSTIRMIRGKGSSRTRGMGNALVSNTSDSILNQLDLLKTQAPLQLGYALSRLEEAKCMISEDEAKDHIPTFIAELDEEKKAARSETMKGIVGLLLPLGCIILFFYWPAGIILISAALTIWIMYRQEWKSRSSAACLRAQQLAEIKESSLESERFDCGQSAEELLEEDESLESSLVLIANDLKSKYIYFDAACRDLGSRAVSWEALAKELLSEMSCNVDESPPNLPERSIIQDEGGKQQDGLEPAKIRISMRRSESGIEFLLTMDDIRSILSALGYKRLPLEWGTVSLKAQERIAIVLSENAGVIYADYEWSFGNGSVRATGRQSDKSLLT